MQTEEWPETKQTSESPSWNPNRCFGTPCFDLVFNKSLQHNINHIDNHIILLINSSKAVFILMDIKNWFLMRSEVNDVQGSGDFTSKAFCVLLTKNPPMECYSYLVVKLRDKLMSLVFILQYSSHNDLYKCHFIKPYTAFSFT